MQGQPTPAPARNNGEIMAQYMMPSGAFNTLRNIEQIIRIMISWSTVTLDVFIRREFGERELSITRVILGFLTIRFFLMIANLQTSMSWIPGIHPLASQRTINVWFISSYILVSIIHLIRIRHRNYVGGVWHSRSWGLSWLDFLISLPPLRIGRFTFQISEWMLYRILEPAICLSVAVMMMPGPSFTRNWFIWASIAMFIHNNMVYNARRNRYLDLLDSHIEGGYYNDLRNDALGQTSSSKTAGHVVMPLPHRDIMEGLESMDIQSTVLETMGGVARTTNQGVETARSMTREA